MVVDPGASSRPGPDGAAAEPHQITHVRGPMARRFRAAVAAQVGVAGWQALLAQVGPPCRARFSQEIGAFEWVEAGLVAELGETWEAYGGEGSTALRGLGAVREILDGTHPWLMRFATPWLLVQVMPRLFSFYYRGAELRLEHQAEGRASLLLKATGYYRSWYTEGIPATAAEALRLAGAEAVEVRHFPPTDPERPWLHRYELSWRD